MGGRRKRRRNRQRAETSGDERQGDLLGGSERADPAVDAADGHGDASEERDEGDAAGPDTAEGGTVVERSGEAAEAASRDQPATGTEEAGKGGDPGSPPDPVARRLARARALVGDGRIREAIDLYRLLVSDHPDSLRARNNLGVLYDELGQHALALEQFEAARDLEPENVEVLTNLGASLGWVGRFEEAERELRRAQKLDPEAVDVRANLGILYYRRGLYAQAEAELRWVCGRDHDHGPAHFYRGEALNRLGRVEDAMEVLERATHLQPENSKAFYTLGILFDKKHMPQEAERMYRRARELARP